MIHSIKIDSDVDERLNEFNAKLKPHEKIVSMAVSGDYLFVTVEKKESSRPASILGNAHMQLLQDQLKRGPKP